jgi:hypothetical protein
MTALSAPNANRTTSTANLSASTGLAHVRIPGSDRTYAVRDVLRGLGLRRDPVTHAWHGTLPAGQGSVLAKQFGLKPQIVPTIEAFAAPAGAPEPPAPPRPIVRARPPHDGSRTRAEARIAFPDATADEAETESRRFSPWETPSGLPDDSREADKGIAERRLRDLRGRVKAARALVAATPGLADVLQRDWRRASRFYARFGITEAMFRHGVEEASNLQIGWKPFE